MIQRSRIKHHFSKLIIVQFSISILGRLSLNWQHSAATNVSATTTFFVDSHRIVALGLQQKLLHLLLGQRAAQHVGHLLQLPHADEPVLVLVKELESLKELGCWILVVSLTLHHVLELVKINCSIPVHINFHHLNSRIR